METSINKTHSVKTDQTLTPTENRIQIENQTQAGNRTRTEPRVPKDNLRKVKATDQTLEKNQTKTVPAGAIKTEAKEKMSLL